MNSPFAKPKMTVLSTNPKGDRERFEALYAKYQRLVRAVAFNLSGSDELDDVVQEAFIKIWKNVDRFRGESQLKTWVYRVTVNTATDHLRKKGRWKFGVLKETERDPVDHEGRSANKELVRKCLAELSEEHRIVIVLATFEGLSAAEIGDVVEVAEGTVRSRLFYAKKQVTELLMKWGVSL